MLAAGLPGFVAPPARMRVAGPIGTGASNAPTLIPDSAGLDLGGQHLRRIRAGKAPFGAAFRAQNLQPVEPS